LLLVPLSLAPAGLNRRADLGVRHLAVYSRLGLAFLVATRR